MKGPTIMIGLLGPGKQEKKMGEGLLESDMPPAMTDEATNKANKAVAVEKAMYGPSDNKRQQCANCEYFDMEMPTLKKGEGFCELWEFRCQDKNVCAAWEFKKPEEEESEDYEGED